MLMNNLSVKVRPVVKCRLSFSWNLLAGCLCAAEGMELLAFWPVCWLVCLCFGLKILSILNNRSIDWSIWWIIHDPWRVNPRPLNRPYYQLSSLKVCNRYPMSLESKLQGYRWSSDSTSYPLAGTNFSHNKGDLVEYIALRLFRSSSSRDGRLRKCWSMCEI